MSVSRILLYLIVRNVSILLLSASRFQNCRRFQQMTIGPKNSFNRCAIRFTKWPVFPVFRSIGKRMARRLLGKHLKTRLSTLKPRFVIDRDCISKRSYRQIPKDGVAADSSHFILKPVSGTAKVRFVIINTSCVISFIS